MICMGGAPYLAVSEQSQLAEDVYSVFVRERRVVFVDLRIYKAFLHMARGTNATRIENIDRETRYDVTRQCIDDSM